MLFVRRLPWATGVRAIQLRYFNGSSGGPQIYFGGVHRYGSRVLWEIGGLSNWKVTCFFFFARSGKRIFFVHANRRNWRYDKCHVGYVVFIAIITQQTTKQLCFLDNSGLRNFSGTFRPSISANSSIRSCPIEIFIRDIELEMRMTENDGMSWRKWRERIFNGFKAEEGKDVGPSPFLGRKLAFFLNWGFLSLCHNSYKI